MLLGGYGTPWLAQGALFLAIWMLAKVVFPTSWCLVVPMSGGWRRPTAPISGWGYVMLCNTKHFHDVTRAKWDPAGLLFLGYPQVMSWPG